MSVTLWKKIQAVVGVAADGIPGDVTAQAIADRLGIEKPAPANTGLDPRSETNIATLSNASCFSNGIKVVQGLDPTTKESQITYKNGDTICYSIGITLGTPTGFTIKSAAGVALGSGTVDTTTGAMSFSCTGGAPIVLNSACSVTSLISASGATATCTDGVCAP